MDQSFGEMSVRGFLTALAAKQPTPGGGAVAGVCGAMAAALAQMVVSYSLGKKNLAPHQALLEDAAKRLERARAIMLELADEDAAAYGLVNELSKLPEHDARRAGLPAAQRTAAQVPLAVTAAAVDALRLMRELCGKSNVHLRSDLAIAGVLAEATASAGAWNVRINVPSLIEQERGPAEREVAHLLSEATRLRQEIERACV
jgi:methenyltetrahydrofolate cyclohydrolase